MNPRWDQDRTRWFRPPELHPLGRRGDRYEYIWIAEPECGKGIYGLGYVIPVSEIVAHVPQTLSANPDMRHVHDEMAAEFEKRLLGNPTTFRQGADFETFFHDRSKK